MGPVYVTLALLNKERQLHRSTVRSSIVSSRILA